jgi:hypothetical protein
LALPRYWPRNRLILQNSFKRCHFIVEHGFRWTRECWDFGKLFTIILAIIENKSGALPQMRLPKWFQKIMDPSNQMASVHSLWFDLKRIFDMFWISNSDQNPASNRSVAMDSKSVNAIWRHSQTALRTLWRIFSITNW